MGVKLEEGSYNLLAILLEALPFNALPQLFFSALPAFYCLRVSSLYTTNCYGNGDAGSTSL